jgi:hypothetical protein
MRRSGSADLPLHGGRVPKWLGERMTRLAGVIVESLIHHYGQREVIRRLSDPFWFQAFGAVMGMDWHSSGITTSVVGALKRAITPRAHELGLHVCGGRGKHSRRTPDELRAVGDATGLDADALVRTSRLTAKVDNTAIQDGFQIYLHSFIVSDAGDWAVVQQGMADQFGLARRYHWCSADVESFVDEPHTAIIGVDQGDILNLTDHQAAPARTGIVELVGAGPAVVLREAQRLVMPRRHDVQPADIDLKRLGAVLATAHDRGVQDFADTLLTEGLGPRTLQSLALVSEVIHGAPARFRDPARFSFAHGGKDGHPFPVPLKIYDETVDVIRRGLEAAVLGVDERTDALKRLHDLTRLTEERRQPAADFEAALARERRHSREWDGRAVGNARRQAVDSPAPTQLTFDFGESS